MLDYVNYNKPFNLHTDACGLGLGAVLYQSDDIGVDRVTAYGSQALSKLERNYLAHISEFLAL